VTRKQARKKNETRDRRCSLQMSKVGRVKNGIEDRAGSAQNRDREKKDAGVDSRPDSEETTHKGNQCKWVSIMDKKTSWG
jgi:hypothetical protein